jgi:hypothetical protein
VTHALFLIHEILYRTLFFAGQEEDINHHDLWGLLQQDGSIPHFYDIIPG